jgi:DNA-binding transcriptional LysR family regulator
MMTTPLEELEITPPQMVLGPHGAVVAAAVAGLGVTLISGQAAQRELDAGTLVELPLPGTPIDRPWHVVTLSACTGSTDLLIRHLLAHRELVWRAAPEATPPDHPERGWRQASRCYLFR